MSDDKQPTGTDGQQHGPDTVEYWKERSRQWEDRAKKNADDLTKFKTQVEDQGKSETERLNTALQQAQTAATQAQAEALRYRVGIEKGLPPAWITRLQGSTEEELAADAEALAKSLPPVTGTPKGRPLAPLDPGGSPPPGDDDGPVDGNDVIRSMLTKQ